MMIIVLLLVHNALAFAGVLNEVQHIIVRSIVDSKVEANEDFSFSFSNSKFFTRDIAIPVAPRGTLLNDDSSTITVLDNSILEGDSGTNTFVISVVSSNSVDIPFSVDYQILPGSALLSEDYTLPSGSGTLNLLGNIPGELQSFIVNVVGDLSVEPTTEIFNVHIQSISSTPVRSIVSSTNDGTEKIIDNDSAEINILDANASELDGQIVFDVTSSAILPSDLILSWVLTHGTTKDSDFTSATPISGSISILAGSTLAQISIPLNNDQLVEATKSFYVVISSPAITRVSVARAKGFGTITDDDSTTMIFNYDLSPGSSGSESVGSATWVISLNNNEVEIPLGFSFTTLDNTATLADGDYSYYTGSFTLTLAAPVTSNVPVIYDDKVEPNEIFHGKILNIQLYGQNVILPSITTLPFTIQNDDYVQVTINGVTSSRNEGNSGVTKFLWRVHLDFPTSYPIEVDYTTVLCTALDTNADFNPISGSVIFSGSFPNEVHSVIVDVNGDLIGEPDEQFALQLTAIRNRGLSVNFDGSQQSVTILNDDLVQVSISDGTVVEGNAGNTLMQFTLSISGGVDTGFQLSVNAASLGAILSQDFLFVNPTTFSVNPGSSPTSFIVSVLVVGDTTVEPDVLT
jgi:hypothetical protein